MNIRKLLSLLTTVIAALTALLNTCKPFMALALDETESAPMMMINYSLILLALVGVAIIGSIAFIVIGAAELVRRRKQKKYSCIQH
jgi:large-conductance mechanosensitive channel